MSEKNKQKKKERRARRYFGSVYRREGREGWYVRFPYGERRISRFGGSTKKDAENYLAYVQLRVKAGLPPDEEEPEEIRFPDFLKDYLKKIKAEHAASTYENEEPRLKNRIGPYFKGYLLSEIGVKDIEGFLTELAEEGSKPATRNRYLAIISGMLGRAVKYGYILSNPCDGINWLPTEDKKVPYLTPADKSRLILILNTEPARLAHMARYMVRPPVAADRVHEAPDGRVLTETPPDPKTGDTVLVLDAMEWLRRLTNQIPDPRSHLVRYYGAYANRCRSLYRDGDGKVTSRPTSSEDPDPLPKSRASWARLLRMVFEVDPLTCMRCGAQMKVIAVITDPAVIDKLLRHVRKRKAGESAGEDDSYDPRAPPAA